MSELRLYHTDKYAGNIANKAAADGSNKLYHTDKYAGNIASKLIDTIPFQLYHTDKYAGNIADLYLSLLKCLYYSRFLSFCQSHFYQKT